MYYLLFEKAAKLVDIGIFMNMWFPKDHVTVDTQYSIYDTETEKIELL